MKAFVMKPDTRNLNTCDQVSYEGLAQKTEWRVTRHSVVIVDLDQDQSDIVPAPGIQSFADQG